MRRDMVANLGEMRVEMKVNKIIEEKSISVEGGINCVENKFEEKYKGLDQKISNVAKDKSIQMEEGVEKVKKQIEENVAKAIEERIERIKTDVDCFKKQKVIFKNYTEEYKFGPFRSGSSIKLSTFDSKASWKVNETQFSIVPDTNGWYSKTKGGHLAASLRTDAADVLQSFSENQRFDFPDLTSALELGFGEKCLKDCSRLQLKSRQQKLTETLQDLPTDIERLSYLACLNCPV